MTSVAGFFLPTIGLPFLLFPFLSLIAGAGVTDLFGISTQPATKITMLSVAAVLYAVIMYFTYYRQTKDFLHVYERGCIVRMLYAPKVIRFDDLEKITFGVEVFGRPRDDEEAMIFLGPTYKGPPPNAAYSAVNFYRLRSRKVVVKTLLQRFDRRDLRKFFEIVADICPRAMPPRYVKPARRDAPNPGFGFPSIKT
jgi:hypothetical protein